MFDFENLQVYQKAKVLNIQVQRLLKAKGFERVVGDQLKRASLSIVLNIAEGSGRFTKPDKRNFYIRARGSVYECVAVMDVLLDEGRLSNEVGQQFYEKYEELSKMLLGLINSQGK